MDSFILLENMRFFAQHGVFEQERLVGNLFEVNLKIKVDISRAVETDNVEDTISYADVYDLISKEMMQPSNLLEHLAGRILHVVKKQYSNISGIEIKVSKLNPPLNGQVEKASVVVLVD